MKVLIDARLYGLENAGLGRYLINLVDNLSKIDVNNHYLILLRKKYFDQLNLPLNWKKIIGDYRHYSLIEQVKLPQVIARERPDLIHFPHFNVPLFCSKPFIVTIHDMLMHKQKGLAATTLSPIKYFLKRIGYRLVFDNAVRKAQHIIVPSESVKKEILNYYHLKPDKITVTYEGVDKRVIAGGDSDFVLKKYGVSKPYFIYAGNAYPHKNIQRAIEAIMLLSKRVETIRLVIVSARNEFIERLEELIRKLKAERIVRVLNYLPDNELGLLYKHSVAFVYPSISEGFGLQGLEVILAGSIPLVSKIPVFEEIYQDNALYFNPFDSKEIARTLRKALVMPQTERQALISKGQEFIKVYSWSKMAEQTLKIYESSHCLRSC